MRFSAAAARGNLPSSGSCPASTKASATPCGMRRLVLSLPYTKSIFVLSGAPKAKSLTTMRAWAGGRGGEGIEVGGRDESSCWWWGTERRTSGRVVLVHLKRHRQHRRVKEIK